MRPFHARARGFRFPLVVLLGAAATLGPAIVGAGDAENPYKAAAGYVYQLASWYYENYKAAEAARTAIKLEANYRPELTPDLALRVTENNVCRLPNVKATTTITWVPFDTPLTTTITGEWLVNGAVVSKNTYSFSGAASKSEWEFWYPERGAYPYAGLYSNDNKVITFDMVAQGEAFNEGPNQIQARLTGTTYEELNVWNPRAWVSLSPVEEVNFTESLSQTKDLDVLVPYNVRKAPNLDVIEQAHPLDAIVELWDKNLALASRKGNEQEYKSPTVTTTQADGILPPDDGTSNNEKRIALDERVHLGDNHPDVIHVLPDFDPIGVVVVHRKWDLAELKGQVYQKVLRLRPTEPWCVGTGVPAVVPGEPPGPPDSEGSYWSIPRYDFRSVIIIPPELDSIPAPGSVLLYIRDTVGVYQRFDSLRANTKGEAVGSQLLPAPGDYKAAIGFRDIFGRHFGAMRTFSTLPDSVDPTPLMDLGTVVLDSLWQEEDAAGFDSVEIVTCDLAGVAFGKSRSVRGVNVRVYVGVDSVTAISDEGGVARFVVPHGAQIGIATLAAPAWREFRGPGLTPRILKPMLVSGTGMGMMDDRIPIYLEPSFAGSCAHSVDVSMFQSAFDHEDTLVVQAVTNLDMAEYSSVDVLVAVLETPIASTALLPWGEPSHRYPYQPAKVDFSGPVPPGMAGEVAQNGVELVFHGSGPDVRVVLGVSSTVSATGSIPRGFGLRSLGNPVLGTARLQLDLPEAATVTARVLDVRGRAVKLLLDAAPQAAGPCVLVWDGTNAEGAEAPPGLYLVEAMVGGRHEIAKLVLVR